MNTRLYGAQVDISKLISLERADARRFISARGGVDVSFCFLFRQLFCWLHFVSSNPRQTNKKKLFLIAIFLLGQLCLMLLSCRVESPICPMWLNKVLWKVNCRKLVIDWSYSAAQRRSALFHMHSIFCVLLWRCILTFSLLIYVWRVNSSSRYVSRHTHSCCRDSFSFL